MQSNQDGPTLTLSDIMHTPSPSPGPQPPIQMQVDPPAPESQKIPEHTRSQSFYVSTNSLANRIDSPELESIGSAEMHAIQARLQELSLVLSDPVNDQASSTRNKEIVSLALRLVSHTPVYPDPQQLASQAETISGLIKQRDLLLQEREEDHKRWQAERDGWDRMAEALIGKRRAAVRAGIDDETHRHMQKLADDNKALREKLSETQHRLSTLEAELTHLRPLLLMQSIDSQNITYSLPSHTSRRKLKPQRDNEGILQPEKDVDMSHPSQGLYQYPTQIDVSRGSVDPLALDPSLLHLPTYYRGDKERELDLAMPSNRKSKKAFKPAPPPVPPARSSASILSDARSECLLLAARKFGRMKAGIVSGIVKEREVAKVKDMNVEATTKRRTRDRKDRHREKTRVPEPQHQLHHSLPPPHLPHHLNAIHQPTVGPSTFPITNYYTHPPPPPPPLPATPHRDSPSNAAHPAHVHSLPTHLHPSMTHGQPQPGSIVYLNPAAMQSSPVPVQMQMRTSAGVSVLVPIGPGVWPMPSTPAPPARRHSSKPLAHPNAGPSNQPIPPNENENDQRSSSQSEPDQEPQTPATPLDSLLNAARTLMIDEDDGSEANPQGSEDNATSRPGASTGRRRRRRAVPPADVQDSPIPKRRKMGVAPLAPAAILGTPERSGPRQGPLPVGGTPLQGRVRSALDVLADQAAQEHERRPSVDPGSQRVTPEEDTRPHTESQTNGKATTIRNHEDLSSHIPLGTVRNKGKGRAVLLEPIPLPESRPRSLSAVTRPPVRALPRQIEEPSTRDRRSPFSPLGGPLPSEQSVVPPRERPPDGRGLSVPRDKVPSQHALAIGLARQNTPVAPPSSTSPDGVPSHASSAIIDGEHRGPNSRGPIDSRAPHEMRGSDAKVPGNLTEESLATQSKTTDEASL